MFVMMVPNNLSDLKLLIRFFIFEVEMLEHHLTPAGTTEALRLYNGPKRTPRLELRQFRPKMD